MEATQKQITCWSIPHRFSQLQRSSRALPLFSISCWQISSVASNCRTRQLGPNYTPLYSKNHRCCEWHVPMHGYHTYGAMICGSAIVLRHLDNSRGPSRFTVQRSKVCWLRKLGAHQRKGSIKMQRIIIIATIIAIFYPPIHSFLPVLAISKDQKNRRKSCAS